MSSRSIRFVMSVGLSLCTVGPGRDTVACGEVSLHALAGQAVSADAAQAREAMKRLREAGPAGLDALFEVHAEKLKSATGWFGHRVQEPDNWKRLAAALDAVGKQKDCYASHLYWYTDFEQAKKAAQASGKPILSLRLLGNLDEEFSCANSRFFRTVLYANEEVSKTLRERFVLHWKSVRPAPKVTIDFGDGRRLERTVTGNSIHYVLDSEGRAIDALPGLYGPKPFLRGIAEAEGVIQRCADDRNKRDRILRDYHLGLAKSTLERWAADLAIAMPGSTIPGEWTKPLKTEAILVNAERAGVPYVSKATVEMPILRAIRTTGGNLETNTDAAAWSKIADLHADDAKLDSHSIAFMTSKAGKPTDAEDLLQRIRAFERLTAQDTVRGEYVERRQIHIWLSGAEKVLFTDGHVTFRKAFEPGTPNQAEPSKAERTIDSLNESVYALLFQTPRSDPWLGLLMPDSYTALDNDGVRLAVSQQPATANQN